MCLKINKPSGDNSTPSASKTTASKEKETQHSQFHFIK